MHAQRENASSSLLLVVFLQYRKKNCCEAYSSTSFCWLKKGRQYVHFYQPWPTQHFCSTHTHTHTHSQTSWASIVCREVNHNVTWGQNVPKMDHTVPQMEHKWILINVLKLNHRGSQCAQNEPSLDTMCWKLTIIDLNVLKMNHHWPQCAQINHHWPQCAQMNHLWPQCALIGAS